MGISDELKDSFGQDFFNRKHTPAGYHNWTTICVCGHISRYHAPEAGGEYRLKEPYPAATRLGAVTVTTVMRAGCLGAMPGRGFQVETVERVDRETLTQTNRINPTCPCTEMREVAKVDRPNRYFNQRIPVDRDDPERHPMLVGLRAFTTHLSRRRAALSDPSWADRELERRFEWIEGKRVCAISRCTEDTAVWPVFINSDGDSELRCAQHR